MPAKYGLDEQGKLRPDTEDFDAVKDTPDDPRKSQISNDAHKYRLALSSAARPAESRHKLTARVCRSSTFLPFLPVPWRQQMNPQRRGMRGSFFRCSTVKQRDLLHELQTPPPFSCPCARFREAHGRDFIPLK